MSGANCAKIVLFVLAITWSHTISSLRYLSPLPQIQVSLTLALGSTSPPERGRCKVLCLCCAPQVKALSSFAAFLLLRTQFMSQFIFEPDLVMLLRDFKNRCLLEQDFS